MSIFEKCTTRFPNRIRVVPLNPDSDFFREPHGAEHATLDTLTCFDFFCLPYIPRMKYRQHWLHIYIYILLYRGFYIYPLSALLSVSLVFTLLLLLQNDREKYGT